MKMIAATTFALILSTSLAQAQARQVEGGVSAGWTNSSANSEKPRANFGRSNTGSLETSQGETAPGDFAVTGGLSGRSGAPNVTGQVAPGTSNSPAGNAAGE